MTEGKYFIDTNILVYANDRTEKAKQTAAITLVIDGIRSGNAIISAQVLSEFWVTVTQKIQVPLDRESAEKQIKSFKAMRIISIEYHTIRAAIHIQKQYQLSYWDALIISAANMAGCEYIYSEDLNSEQRYGNVIVRNPFISM
jgi:predicted nucleic acid-binding protein